MTITESRLEDKVIEAPDAGRATAVHRTGFVIGGALLVTLDLSGFNLNPLEMPVVAGLVILLLGVPHGAFDVAIWKANHPAGSRSDLGKILFLYIGLAFAFFGLWLLAPELALPAFLAIAVYHFSGDWKCDLEFVPRLVIAAAMLTAPAGLNRVEVTEIFAWLAPEETAHLVALVMAAMAVPLLQASCVAILLLATERPVAAAEVVTVLALAWLTPPLLFFLVYFCALHSVRHMIETWRDLKPRTGRNFALAAFPYAPAAVIGTLAGALTLSTLPLGPAVIGAVFMALGALTVPHMVLIDSQK